MAYYDPYGGGDYEQPRPSASDGGGDYQPYQVPAPQPSQTPAPSYTPPPNAGSWNDYYRQPGTTTAPASPYTMGQDYRYQMPGGTNTGTSYGQTGQYAHQLEGFNTAKLADPTHTSAKYQFARVASRYAPTQQGFAQLVQDPDFQRLGMQSIGNGNIRLPNGDVIDVVRGFQSGGQAWQWGAQTPEAAPPQQQADPWAQYAQQQQAWQQQQAQQWQDYYAQLAAWQAYQQQINPPSPMGTATNLPVPITEIPSPALTGYYKAPQVILPPLPSYGGPGYNQGVGLQAGAAPTGQAINYLAQGMPSPYYYG